MCITNFQTWAHFFGILTFEIYFLKRIIISHVIYHTFLRYYDLNSKNGNQFLIHTYIIFYVWQFELVIDLLLMFFSCLRPALQYLVSISLSDRKSIWNGDVWLRKKTWLSFSSQFFSLPYAQIGKQNRCGFSSVLLFCRTFMKSEMKIAYSIVWQ